MASSGEEGYLLSKPMKGFKCESTVILNIHKDLLQVACKKVSLKVGPPKLTKCVAVLMPGLVSALSWLQLKLEKKPHRILIVQEFSNF